MLGALLHTGVSRELLQQTAAALNIGAEIRDLLPEGVDAASEQIAAQLGDFLLHSQKQIAHGVQEDCCEANMLWVWSPSRKVTLNTPLRSGTTTTLIVTSFCIVQSSSTRWPRGHAPEDFRTDHQCAGTILLTAAHEIDQRHAEALMRQ